MFGFATYDNCTLVIIDAATSELVGTGLPCAVSQGFLGYNPEVHRQATPDVQIFLRVLFQLQ